MKKHAALATLITIIATPINLFSALPSEKLPRKIVTITIPTKTTKTTWEKAQENKLRTTVGAYAGVLALLAPIAIVERNYNEPKQNTNLAYSCAGTVLLAGLSYYLLQPLFSEENNDTSKEQNNNQY